MAGSAGKEGGRVPLYLESPEAKYIPTYLPSIYSLGSLYSASRIGLSVLRGPWIPFLSLSLSLYLYPLSSACPKPRQRIPLLSPPWCTRHRAHRGHRKTLRQPSGSALPCLANVRPRCAVRFLLSRHSRSFAVFARSLPSAPPSLSLWTTLSRFPLRSSSLSSLAPNVGWLSRT